MSRVLVVDDEAGIRKVVRDALERAGHSVETAAEGEEASGLFDGAGFDLVITDLSMPQMDGLSLVEHIRRTSRVPILVLTVRQEEREKVRLLDAGADDYVTKPFGVAELVARARALLRRAEDRPGAPELSRFGDIDIDRQARLVRKAGRPLHLTPTEFSLLTALLSRPGAVWTHRQLHSAVWGSSAGVTNDTLRVHMGSLRRKLEDDPNRPRWILTEPWVGYRFSPDS
jgi:two-component system, OmpR family, KDP operon response regulator KdpE